MNIKYLLYAIAIVFLFSVIGNVVQYFQPPKVITKTVKETVDTTLIKQELSAKIEAKLKAKLKPEVKTVYKTKKQYVNIDSLYEEAKEFWANKLALQNKDSLGYYDFIASADTTYQDSIAKIDIKYTSPYPLPPNGRFDINALWYNREIFHTKETEIVMQPKKTFWESLFGNFSYSINAGFGQGIIHKQVDFYYGIGISYDLKKIFVSD